MLMPISNADSAPYWEAASRDILLIRICRQCGQSHFMPRYICPFCWSDELDWVEASGRGTIYSFTIVHRASDPSFADRTPYVLALVELAEGPRMVSNIIGADALESRIGYAVSVQFEDRPNDTKVPQFALCGNRLPTDTH